MANSKNIRKNEIAEELQLALDEGKVKYIMVQQKFTKTGDLGGFTIREFDIN